MDGMGGFFVEAGKFYSVNPVYLMALTIHESGWGTSHFARTRNNFWGYKAFDSDPNKAGRFHSKEGGVHFMACFLANSYLTPPSNPRKLYKLPPQEVGLESQYQWQGQFYAAPTLEGIYKIGQFEGRPYKYATAPHSPHVVLGFMNKFVEFIQRPVGGIVLANKPVEPQGLKQVVVQPGDSLWAIAAREYGNGARWMDIAVANGIKANAQGKYIIYAGQRLSIPDKPASVVINNPVNNVRTYKVQPGDSLWSIAQEHYGRGDQYLRIFEANRNIIANPNVIQQGWVLRIP